MKHINELNDFSLILSNPDLGNWYFHTLFRVKEHNPAEYENEMKKIKDSGILHDLILECNTDYLPFAFSSLQTDLFKPFFNELLSIWSKPDINGSAAFEVIAKIDESVAISTAIEWIETPNGSKDISRILKILIFASENNGPNFKKLNSVIFNMIENDKNDVSREIYKRLFLKMIFDYEETIQQNTIVEFVASGIKNKNLNKKLLDLSSFLTNSEYLFRWLSSGNITKVVFSTVDWFFKPSAPLEDLDKISEYGEKELFEKVQELFNEISSDSTNQLIQLLAKTKYKWGKLISNSRFKEDFSYFLFSIIIDEWTISDSDYGSFSTEQLINLLKSPFVTNLVYDNIMLKLKDCDQTELSDLILNSLTNNLNNRDILFLIRACGDLKINNSTSVLFDIIDANLGDEVSNETGLALEKLADSQNNFENEWRSLSVKNILYVLQAMIKRRVSVYEKLIESWDRLKTEFINLWCQFAEEDGDVRLILFIENEIDKDDNLLKIEYLGACYSYLCNINSKTGKYLSGFNTAFEAADSDPYQEPDTTQGSSVPSVIMELKCANCGEINDYKVRYIASTYGFITDEPYIGGDLKCSFCNTYNEFNLTAKGFTSFFREFEKYNKYLSYGKEKKSVIDVLAPFTYRNREFSLKSAVGFFKEKVKKEPDNVDYLLRLGHIYHTAFSYRLAIEIFAHIRTIDPASIETALFQALIVGEYGDKNGAMDILNNVLSYKGKWTTYLFKGKKDRLLFGKNFVAELMNLSGIIGQSPIYIPPENFLAVQKIGKNDPCPCGSNKKFKFCCMRKKIY